MIPEKGRPVAEVLDSLRALRAFDTDWRSGRLWNLVYYVNDEVGELVRAAAGEFVNENGVSPLAFPSIRRLQADLLAFSGSLLGSGPSAFGVVTSGGSESILMATLSARERRDGRGRGQGRFEVLLPMTAHPAWDKAAFYLGLRPIRVPVGDDLRAAPDAMRAAISDRTALLVGSAPSYSHGVVDPIPELAAIAAEHGICMHVDACLGGFLLPFARRLGYPIPDFDLSVEGVTSISADLHKYGFAPKGVGILLYREAALRELQYFVHSNWAGGVYATPTAGGSRSVSPMAAAWAVIQHLGIEGYLRIAQDLMEGAKRLIEGLRRIDGLEVQGNPVMTVLAFTSSRYDVYALADRLQMLGWSFDRQHAPPAIHVSITQLRHVALIDDLLRDIQRELEQIPESASTGVPRVDGSYSVGGIPSDDDLHRLVVGFLSATLDPENGV